MKNMNSVYIHVKKSNRTNAKMELINILPQQELYPEKIEDYVISALDKYIGAMRKLKTSKFIFTTSTFIYHNTINKGINGIYNKSEFIPIRCNYELYSIEQLINTLYHTIAINFVNTDILGIAEIHEKSSIRYYIKEYYIKGVKSYE